MPSTLESKDIANIIAEIRGKNPDAEDEVYLDDSVVNNGFLVSDSVCSVFVCTSVVFNKQFTFRRAKNEGILLRFTNCTFEDSCVFYDSKIGDLYFENCTGEIITLNQVTVNVVQVEKCSFNRAVLISIEAKSINLFSNSNTSVAFTRVSAEKIHVGNNSAGFDLLINGNRDLPKTSLIDTLQIEVSPTLIGSIMATDVAINKLLLRGKLDKGLIDCNSCRFEEISIEKFVNGGTLKFSNPYFLQGAQLKIRESDLGKVVLFGIDFNSISAIHISTANLNDIIHSGVIWCKHIEDNLASGMSFVELRDVYKQLKNVAAKQHDKPDELKFYALEMDAYFKAIRNASGKRGDKWILRFNKWTNNHGQSWTKPLRIILAAVFVLYFPIKILLGFQQFSFTPDHIFTAFAEMLECFNPLRKFTDSFGQHEVAVRPWRIALAKIVDIFFLRIVVGLLIFQMVKAFRKYIK